MLYLDPYQYVQGIDYQEHGANQKVVSVLRPKNNLEFVVFHSCKWLSGLDCFFLYLKLKQSHSSAFGVVCVRQASSSFRYISCPEYHEQVIEKEMTALSLEFPTRLLGFRSLNFAVIDIRKSIK